MQQWWEKNNFDTNIPQPMLESLPEPPPKLINHPATKPASEPNKGERTLQPTHQSTTQPMLKPAPKPPPEPINHPAAKPASKPMPKPIQSNKGECMIVDAPISHPANAQTSARVNALANKVE